MASITPKMGNLGFAIVLSVYGLVYSQPWQGANYWNNRYSAYGINYDSK